MPEELVKGSIDLAHSLTETRTLTEFFTRLEACGGLLRLDPKVWPGVIKGMRTLADLKVTDGTMHLVTAWSLATTGEDDLAKRYLRMARKWDGKHPAIDALAKALDPEAQKPEEPKPKAPEKAKPKTDEEGQRVPDPYDLRQQIAKQAKKKPRIAKKAKAKAK